MIPQRLHRLDSSGLKLAAEGSPQRTGSEPLEAISNTYRYLLRPTYWR